MGSKNSNSHFMVYFDGKPVELAQEPAQFVVAHTESGKIVQDTPDFSAGGVSAAEITAAIGAASRAWAAASTTVEKMAGALAKAWELYQAMKWVEAYNKPLASRYHHTKKKRIRKKYARRILIWYREEVHEC